MKTNSIFKTKNLLWSLGIGMVWVLLVSSLGAVSEVIADTMLKPGAF
jgi:hypothetical protein